MEGRGSTLEEVELGHFDLFQGLLPRSFRQLRFFASHYDDETDENGGDAQYESIDSDLD